MTDLDKIFAPEVIDRFEPPVSADKLTHTYNDVRLDSKGQPYDFPRITSLLGGLRSDVAAWYTKESGNEFNTFKLGEMINPVREKFWSDPRFAEAFTLLNLDYNDRQKATIPWWNEVAAGELGYEHKGEGIHVNFAPRHSLETQLMRAGIERPVKNVSVGGLIFTAPENGAPDGYVVIGLRGGASYSNTWAINAGALKVSDEFKQGKTSIYDVFNAMELAPEFGLTPTDVTDSRLHHRYFCHVIDKGPAYVFAVKTPFTKQQLHHKWEQNLDPDKAEHDAPVFIPANPDEVNVFIREHYRGTVANRDGRKDDERYLLHPSALSLAAWSGMPLDELRSLYREGNW